MAIVPNLNGVPISNQVPLVDPRNLSTRERSFQDDPFRTTTQITLINGNQTIASSKQIRNAIQVLNPVESAATVYVSNNPLSAAGGIPILPGNGFSFKGSQAQLAFYCFGVAGQTLTVLEG